MRKLVDQYHQMNPLSLTLMCFRLFACTLTVRGSKMPRRQMVSNLYLTSSSETLALLILSTFSVGMYSLKIQTFFPSFLPFRTRPLLSYSASFSFFICLVLIPLSTSTSFSSIALLIFFILCSCCLNYLSSFRSRSAIWACLFFLFRCRIATSGSSPTTFTFRGFGLELQQSITRSFSFSTSSSRGLQECPLQGAMTDGISLGRQRCLPWSGACQMSSTELRLRVLEILLLYTFLGRGVAVGLNLLGLRGGRVLSLSSVTMSAGLNFSLMFRSCQWACASRSPETSMFLAHFFLFCLPFRPLTLTRSFISTFNNKDYLSKYHIYLLEQQLAATDIQIDDSQCLLK